MYTRLRFPALALCVLAAGCSGGGAGDSLIQPVGDARVAETVNGTPVPQALIESFAKARNADLNVPEQRAQVLKVFADYVLLADLAQKDGMAKNPAFAAEVETARLSALANAVMRELQQQTPISDEALKAEYDATVARSGKNDYDFSQLLFAGEDDAAKAGAELAAGKNFPEVYDAWKAKAKQAKVFTHVRLDQLPEELGKVLAQLKIGDSTKAPVKTSFGWHLVHLDATSPYTPPSFDHVKEGLRRQLSMKTGQQRLDKLREQARIGYPPGSAAPLKPPAPATAPAPAAPPAAPAPAASDGKRG